MIERWKQRRRAGRGARHLIRAQVREAVRHRWRHILTGYAIVGVGIAAVAAVVWPANENLGWLVIGVGLGVVPWLWQVVLNSLGFANRQMGPEAELWTATELARLDRRSWRVFHDVPLAHSNVDHVVVGPGRIYAVETTWTAMSIDHGVKQRLGSTAERRARELAGRLERSGCPRPVVPLLVLWGPHVAVSLGERAATLRPGREVRPHDVRIVAGTAASTWLQRIESAADRFELDLPVERVIEAIVAGPSPRPVGS